MDHIQENRNIRIAAAVLAGGRSKRMGSPKESVIIPGDGRTFLDRICDEVDEVYPERIIARYISVRCGQHVNRKGYETVTDRYEGTGPIGGIASVLKQARGDGADAVLVIACDMIRYDHAEIRRICGQYAGEGVLFARTNMLVQPLASIYSVSAAEDLMSMIAPKDYRIRDLAGYIQNVGYYDSDHVDNYENQNFPFV